MNTALCLLLPLSLLGCFDLQTVDPGNEVEPFLVDDFEGAERLPAPPFQRWACRAFQPNDDPSGVEDCTFDNAGNGSPTSFMGRFTLHDRPNQVPEYAGASLSTNATRPLDLRRYRDLSMALRFLPLDVVVANGSTFYVELTCQSARSGGAGGRSDEPFSITREVQLNPPSWTSIRLGFEEFVQPPWQEARIDGGVQACLARVDSIAFVLSTAVGDGGTGKAELYIDDVSFE